jgi:glycosyltransferase involved in cell wall biosynthesis
VRIVGIVHSDDPQHYEHVVRLGRYWNAIVAVSHAIAARTAELDPSLASRIQVIPYGVEVAEHLPEASGKPEAELRLVYAGRLVQAQKRVLDLPPILRALLDRRVPVHLTVLGTGSEQEVFQRACTDLKVSEHVTFLGTLSNRQSCEVMAQHDVFVLTSEFEGLPLSLLESMGQGCVPVVTDISSGIPEVIHEGVNGYRVAVGDTQKFADRLELLYRNPELRRTMAVKAYDAICSGNYRVQDMAASYAALFRRVVKESAEGVFVRPPAGIAVPPSLPWPEYLPGVVQKFGHLGKRLLTEMKS